MDPVNSIASPFALPEDNFIHLCPLGEFPNLEQGIVQVLDRSALRTQEAEFNADKAQPGSAGLLIDFDHGSMDPDRSSEAAGWINDVQNRASGLWVKPRWSDSGLAAVANGRFRFTSPVFDPHRVELLGNNRVRPLKLLRAALTNDPNLKGLQPIANRRGGPSGRPPGNDVVRQASEILLVLSNRRKSQTGEDFDTAWNQVRARNPLLNRLAWETAPLKNRDMTFVKFEDLGLDVQAAVAEYEAAVKEHVRTTNQYGAYGSSFVPFTAENPALLEEAFDRQLDSLTAQFGGDFDRAWEHLKEKNGMGFARAVIAIGSRGAKRVLHPPSRLDASSSTFAHSAAK